MKNLVGKTAIVVGAGRGLGRSIALALAAEGSDVVVASRTTQEVEQVAEEITRKGMRAIAMGVDASDSEQVNRMIRETASRFSTIDILVNCQGESLIKPTIETTTEEFDRLLRVNLRSVFLTCRAVLPYMYKQKGGHIFNISSLAGITGAASIAAYAGTKAGVIGLSKALAIELKPQNIKVNVICPAPMDTPMRWKATPEFERNKVISPEKVAQIVVLLASMEDAFIKEPITPNSINY